MKKCVLIFDDDQEITAITKKILEKRNYRVETKRRCDNIIDDISELSPDIILMDLWIPNIGGEKALDLLKRSHPPLQVPVIFFSASVEIEKISERAGADGFLKKPFEIAVLFEIIERNI